MQVVNFCPAIYAFGAIVFALILQAEPVAAQSCVSVPHAAATQSALNNFWGINAKLCRLPPGSGGAFAYRSLGVVTADQDWLDSVAQNNGAWAATGVLAHEWGHMVQGNVPMGTAAELQADCLAGVYMRGVGLPPSTVSQFANLNLLAGDPVWSLAGHGLGGQRYNAAKRGYDGLDYFNGSNLALICPYSAF